MCLCRLFLISCVSTGLLACRSESESTEPRNASSSSPETSSEKDPLSDCEANQTPLTLNEPVTVSLSLPFSHSEVLLQRLIREQGLRFDNPREYPLQVSVQSISDAFWSFPTWTVFTAEDEFSVSSLGDQVSCIFSKEQASMNPDIKTVLIGGKNASETGFLPEAEVLSAVESCFERYFQNNVPFPSLSRSQSQGHIVEIALQVTLTDHFPAYQTESFFYPLRLKNQISSLPDIELFIHVDKGDYRIISPAYRNGCDTPPLTLSVSHLQERFK